MLLLAALLTGTSGAWADSKTLNPTTEINGRLKYENSTYSHQTAPASVTSDTYVESGWRNSGFYILQEWDLSDVDVDRIKSITYTFYTKQNTGGILWIYGSSVPATTISAADLGAAMKSVMGTDPNEDNATTLENNAWVKSASRTEITSGSVYKQVLTISAAADLTKFKNAVSGNKIALVVSASAKSKVEFYTFLNSDYKAQMEIEYYPISVTVGGTTTYYTEINSTLNSSLTDDATIKIYDDVNMSNRIQAQSSKTVEILPQKDGITITNTNAGNLSFLSNVASGRVNVGSDTYAMTVKYSSATITNCVVESSNSSAIVDINNVTFSGISTSQEYGLIKANSGKVYLKNVTFSNCASTYATNPSIIKCSNDDGVVFEGNNQFTNCTGYDIFAASRFKVHATNGVTNTTPIKVYTTLALGSVVATTVAADEVAKFDLQDSNKGLLKRTGQARYDMYATEAYTLAVTDAGAATLILPFASTIPSGVSAYTLTHTDGSSTVNAASVETTLSANTPVLINASEDSYKFVNTSNVSTETTGSGTHTSGALTGVYASTSLNSTDNPDTYILRKQDEVVGFYKVGTTARTVAANRAYLTATNVPDAGAGARGLTIVFDDNEATGIEEAVKSEELKVKSYYDLSGRRVENPTKGLYIVNGKKVIIK